MTSFLADGLYNPLQVLLVGLLTYSGLSSLGAALLRAVRIELPQTWRQVVAVLLGIQSLSLLVQILGMTRLTGPGVLIPIELGLLGIGIMATLPWIRAALHLRFPPLRSTAMMQLGIVLSAVFACTLVALAPASKVDEIYYHMLLPSRIVADGGLVFYKVPWESAILPDMIYQIAQAPMHAILTPDAGNLLSWLLNLEMLWFAWQIVRERNKPIAWAFLWIGVLSVGMYPAVWQVTAGGHAMGALALSAATVAFCLRDEIIARIGPVQFAALFSILCLSAGSTKVTLLPLVALMSILVLRGLLRSGHTVAGRSVLVAFLMPWIVFLGPIVLWTWDKSGAPFGPMLSDFFPASVFGPHWSADLLKQVGDADYQEFPATVLMYFIVDHTPLFYLGAIGAFFWTDIAKDRRIEAAALFGVQTIIIGLLLLPSARYYGGLDYGLVILFAACASFPNQERWISGGAARIASVLLLFPWLAGQLYYDYQFFPVSLGLQHPEEFYGKYVAFYRDFRRLDLVLPRNAVLLIDFRAGNVYAPRPVILDPDDLPEGKPVFAMIARDNLSNLHEILPGYVRGEIVYQNADAVTEAYRIPGTAAERQAIVVVRMLAR